MILKRFYEEKIAQASYLIGCAATGEAVVVDPHRDVEMYLRAAEAEGLRITAVTETHIHADFVSGSRELARRTGATLYLSDEGDAEWKYAFAREERAVLLKDGDRITVGNVRLQAMHTPGHTPEHLTFLITDGAASEEPMGALTGDFVFAGDVGRPDLLERAAHYVGTMEAGARVLFHSLQRFRALPAHLLIWPGHGAGSACGKSLGGVPASSLGYELLTNWAFQIADEDAFVAAALAGQPEPPRYFAEMKRINKLGPPLLDGFRLPARLGSERLPALLATEASIVDLRPTPAYLAASVPGTLHLPPGRLFTQWAGSLLPYSAPIILIAENESQIETAVRDLAIIGLDNVAGWFGAEALADAARHGLKLIAIPQASVEDLFANGAERDTLILDVRGENEWQAGHIPGAVHIPLGDLPERAGDLPSDRPIAVHCQGGGRSPIGVSLLRRQGFERVLNLRGGYYAYKAAGLPIATSSATEDAATEPNRV